MAKVAIAELRKAILKEVPRDGSAIGNIRLRARVEARLGVKVGEAAYFEARDALIGNGKLATGKGRGGSVRRNTKQATDEAPALTLETQQVPPEARIARPKQASLAIRARKPGEPSRTARKGDKDARVLAYRHDQKRRNNPDVGVVTPETDPEQPKTTWAYDPHIDPALQFDSSRAEVERVIDEALASDDESTLRGALETLRRMAAPYLNWSGKAERTSFEVDTVSLHVHERIDPASILAAVRKRLQQDKGEHAGTGDMFRAWFEEPLPYREAIEFYKHDRGWSNRLVAGDSLLVMNSLLQKEGMAGQVHMIYIDPPYGIKYGSNFQPFVNKRDVKDRKDEDLTVEPEMIKAFRDTWELGIHSYLTYLRDRLLLARELLHESGSVFVQISDENVHHVRELLDEVFGASNFLSMIAYRTSGSLGSDVVSGIYDLIIWYGKDSQQSKINQLFIEREPESYQFVNLPGGYWKRTDSTPGDPSLSFTTENLVSTGYTATCIFPIKFQGRSFQPASGKSWKTTASGVGTLANSSRLIATGSTVRYLLKFSDYPVMRMTNLWSDLTGATDKTYAVQTSETAVQRCLLMTTDSGDLVLDPTCGSGTMAVVAEKWGRRWITCDTSRVAVTLAKQRLVTASYDYYELKYPHEGLRGGFIYKTVPHVTLKSIANNPDIDELYEKLHPAIEQALAALNVTLRNQPPTEPFAVTEGGRKGQRLDFSRPSSPRKRGSSDVSVDATSMDSRLRGNDDVDGLQEWEVPFDFPHNWPAAARAAFDAFHAARQAMQKKMDDSIAAHADQETLYDQPTVSKDKLRITGPFTVEAVPFPTVLALDEPSPQPAPASGRGGFDFEADASIARSGESARQHRWRDELLKTGIRGKGGQMLRFAELETLPDTRYLHCTGYLDSGERVVVSFGPEHAALEQRQVELAMREAGDLFPRPKLIVFCAFTFDPEAAKDIDATRGITALKAQMNIDLLTEDLKKARRNNQSFWLMGQPDVDLRRVPPPSSVGGRGAGGEGEWYVVEVNGFDYFDTTTGELKSGGKKNIAAWALDTDYDERSLFPRQVFFPMAGAKDGWNKLKRDIKAELNEALLDKLHGTVSLPFEPGENRKVAVKIVDDRGIESLKVIALP